MIDFPRIIEALKTEPAYWNLEIVSRECKQDGDNPTAHYLQMLLRMPLQDRLPATLRDAAKS